MATTYSFEPDNLIYGQFPIARETGKAGEEISRGDLVVNTDGTITKATSATLANVSGIAAHQAITDIPVTYYATGEFFTSGVNLPEGVTEEAAKAALAKLNIYLK